MTAKCKIQNYTVEFKNLVILMDFLRHRRTLVLSIIILLVGLFLRFWQLPQRFIFGGDESYLIFEVANLAGGHLSLVGFEAGGVGHIKLAPFLLYFLTGPFILAAGHPLFVEVVLSLFGAARGVLFYLIGKNIFGERIGILAAVFYLISAQVNIIDRKFFGATFLILSSLLTFYFLARIAKEKIIANLNLIILGSIIGLSFSAHYQSAFLFLASLMFLILTKRTLFQIKHFLILTASVIFWLLPLGLFELRHNFSVTRGFFLLAGQYTTLSPIEGLIKSAEYLVQNFYGLVASTVYKFSFQTESFLPILFLAGFTIFALIVFLLKNERYQAFRPLITYFAILVFLALFILSFYQRPHYDIDPYYWFLVPVGIFLWAIFINYLLSQKRTLILGLGLLLFFLIFNFYTFFTQVPADSYLTKKHIVDAILNNIEEKNSKKTVIKFDYGEPPAFDYLFNYYAKKRQINPSSIILISRHELFQERVLLGGIAGPVKILPKSAGENLMPNYLITSLQADIKNFSLFAVYPPYLIQVNPAVN